MLDELALLRRFEPILCYTEGELYFPCAVENHVARCSLWQRNKAGKVKKLVPAGQLTLEKLATYGATVLDSTLYLRLVNQPMSLPDYQRWLHRPNRPLFRSVGRLARVSLIARWVDAFFSLALLMRGRVPGGTTAAAEQHYQAMRASDPRYVYYGRVLREGGYLILHYLFFYPMNDFRSSFNGINDHEADWEQVMVYATEEEGQIVPRWAAYASHDFSGDDLRRRWDDPELHKLGEHPIVYSGAGSHASYFLPGEYVLSIEPALLKPITGFLHWVEDFWSERLKQGDEPIDADNMDSDMDEDDLNGGYMNGDDEEDTHPPSSAFRIPFIDYARGDGLRIGPNEKEQWSPILLADDLPWVTDYRGLWGLDTQDPFGGERAPSGPKYNRDGSVRYSWQDPLGWAGLDKVTPPNLLPAELAAKLARCEEERTRLDQLIETQRILTRDLHLEVAALRDMLHATATVKEREEQLETQQAELRTLHNKRTILDETIRATRTYLAALQHGIQGEVQAHITHKHMPASPIANIGRLVEIWSALSVGLLLLTLVVSFVWRAQNWLLFTLLISMSFLGVEALVHRRLIPYLLNLTIGLAIVASLILMLSFWKYLLLGALLISVIVLLRDNLNEVRAK